MHANRIALAIFCSVVIAIGPLVKGQTVPVVVTSGTTITTSTTIKLGPVIMTADFVAWPALPTAPFTIINGTHLQIVAPTDGVPNPVVAWYKNNTPLSATGDTLDIPSATKSDSGYYSAFVCSQDGKTSGATLDTAFVLVTNPGQRLTNSSTRAHIDANQSSVLSGFVIEQGPKKAMVLVRAVGPTLAYLDVGDALAAPQMHLLDASGREVSPYVPPSGVIGFTTDTAAARVGAFPLPKGSKDVASLYLLSPGAYVAQVSSANGGTGTVLVEAYEVPM